MGRLSANRWLRSICFIFRTFFSPFLLSSLSFRIRWLWCLSPSSLLMPFPRLVRNLRLERRPRHFYTKLLARKISLGWDLWLRPKATPWLEWGLWGWLLWDRECGWSMPQAIGSGIRLHGPRRPMLIWKLIFHIQIVHLICTCIWQPHWQFDQKQGKYNRQIEFMQWQYVQQQPHQWQTLQYPVRTRGCWKPSQHHTFAQGHWYIWRHHQI